MQRYRVFIWAGLMLAVSWLSLAVLEPNPPGARTARLGYFLGSLFAHANLAAAWAVFGPGWLIVRVPLSVAWAFSLPAAIAINLAVNGGPSDVVFALGGCLVAQWLVLLFLFAGIALGLGLRLRHTTEAETGTDGQRFRFGIRDLLIVIAVCGVVLGLGRVIVPSISISGGGETSIFIFLAVAAVVMTLPLLLASLMWRKAIVGVLLALILIGAATALELPIMEMLGGMRGPTRNDFIAINVGSAVLILMVAGVVRLNGYCLFVRRVPKDL